MFRRAGNYVDKIWRGASLPTSRLSNQPNSTWRNLITAQVLGITVPPSLLAIADEVIE